ncbi:MAG: phospho-N-acetylmuramoyl-pentapeptide-transferase [Armatimonadetes bacterium]|nr:phospho-N-acetylmuramoyl-pentapeptide-transferase [Armatimonadota bacterium]
MVASLFGPALLGLLTAILAGRLLIPLLQRLKARQVISTDAPVRHLSKGGTPTMGGGIILVGALVGGLLYPRPGGSGTTVAALWITTLAFGAIGFLDDYLIIRRGKNLGLRAREKLALQFLVAGAFSVWWYAHDRALASVLLVQSGPDPQRVALALFHALLLAGLSNAVNLTDGLDGLAAGVSLPIWGALALLAALGMAFGSFADLGLAAACAGFAGASIGYVWYNAHPAQVFMGDTGSLAIGGGLAAAAILLRQEWLLIPAAAVHWAEAASVTLQVVYFKATGGKRIFRRSPLHHHFEELQVPETRIVARFTIASIACCLLALALVYRTA